MAARRTEPGNRGTMARDDDLPSASASADAVLPMSKPQIFLIRMVLFLLIVALVCVIIWTPLVAAFLGNVFINALIVAVLVFGVAFCVLRVTSLSPEVDWVNRFRRGEPGLAVPGKTALLAPMAAMLRDRQGPMALSATSTRIILESIGARLDEGRENTRYLTNLLIFLGILGTFWGLAISVGHIDDVVDGLSVGAGDPEAAFGDLKDGLAGPLAGLATAVSSSLFGIGGSLVLGFLGLQAAHAQTRFYNEFEEWLSTVTQLTDTTPNTIAPPGQLFAERAAAPDLSGLTAAVQASAEGIQALRETIERNETQRGQTEQWIIQTTQNLSDLDQVIRSQKELMNGIAAVIHEVASQQQAHGHDTLTTTRAIHDLTARLLALSEQRGMAPTPAAASVGNAAPAAISSALDQRLAQLVALTQQSDDRLGHSLSAIHEIAARLLSHAEDGKADQALTALTQLNETTGRLLSVTQSTPRVVATPSGDAPAAVAPPAMDYGVLHDLNDKVARLVSHADQFAGGSDGEVSALLRRLDESTGRIVTAAEALAEGGGGRAMDTISQYVQELAQLARGSSEREILEALRSINQIAYSAREGAEEGRSELVEGLRAEMKVLTKTIAALIIEGRRNDARPRGEG